MSFLRRPLLAFALAALIVLPVMYAVGNRSASGDAPIAPPDLSPQELVARGRYLAKAGNCAGCHTTPGGAFMAGGLAFETPFGTVHATNITPDRETGIGAWSGRDFLNAMRHGVRPDGGHLYPVFPYTFYTRVTDADVAAIFAWLKTVPAVRAETPPNDLRFPFNLRPLLAFWKAAFFERGPLQADPEQSPRLRRGAYLVQALAHCGACHSPRNAFGAVKDGLALSGGAYLDRVPSGAHRRWAAPNLTASERGLGLWSQQDLVDYLATGRNAFLESFGPMNEVIVGSTRHLEREDIEAMAAWLKQRPAIDATAGGRAVRDRLVLGRGRTVYNLHCGTCHLPTGQGDPEMAPRLDRGSLVVQSEDPAAMINVILYGPELPHPPLRSPWREPMDDYQYLLDDEEIAAVATFVRQSWGNQAPPVTPEQVARQR